MGEYSSLFQSRPHYAVFGCPVVSESRMIVLRSNVEARVSASIAEFHPSLCKPASISRVNQSGADLDTITKNLHMFQNWTR